AGLRLPPANSTPSAMRTRRPCCPTAWYLSQGGSILVAVTPARNGMIRPAGVGLLLVISIPDAISIRRRCCPTAWSLPRGDLISASLRWQALNSILLQGRPQPQPQPQQPRRRQALPLARLLRLIHPLLQRLQRRRRKPQNSYPDLFPTPGFARIHRNGPTPGNERYHVEAQVWM